MVINDVTTIATRERRRDVVIIFIWGTFFFFLEKRLEVIFFFFFYFLTDEEVFFFVRYTSTLKCTKSKTWFLMCTTEQHLTGKLEKEHSVSLVKSRETWLLWENKISAPNVARSARDGKSKSMIVFFFNLMMNNIKREKRQWGEKINEHFHIHKYLIENKEKKRIWIHYNYNYILNFTLF